jgi:hypothetical protein
MRIIMRSMRICGVQRQPLWVFMCDSAKTQPAHALPNLHQVPKSIGASLSPTCSAQNFPRQRQSADAAVQPALPSCPSEFRVEKVKVKACVVTCEGLDARSFIRLGWAYRRERVRAEPQTKQVRWQRTAGPWRAAARNV